MRTCPYCAEDIKVEAIKCKHCGSSFLSDSSQNKISSVATDRIHMTLVKRSKDYFTMISLSLVFIIIFLYHCYAIVTSGDVLKIHMNILFLLFIFFILPLVYLFVPRTFITDCQYCGKKVAIFSKAEKYTCPKCEILHIIDWIEHEQNPPLVNAKYQEPLGSLDSYINTPQKDRNKSRSRGKKLALIVGIIIGIYGFTMYKLFLVSNNSRELPLIGRLIKIFHPTITPLTVSCEQVVTSRTLWLNEPKTVQLTSSFTFKNIGASGYIYLHSYLVLGNNLFQDKEKLMVEKNETKTVYRISKIVSADKANGHQCQYIYRLDKFL